MQNGSLIGAERQRGLAVWEFRWRELAGNGKRTHRRIVLGWVDRLVDEAAARQAVSALCIDINAGDARITANITTVSELASAVGKFLSDYPNHLRLTSPKKHIGKSQCGWRDRDLLRACVD